MKEKIRDIVGQFRWSITWLRESQKENRENRGKKNVQNTTNEFPRIEQNIQIEWLYGVFKKMKEIRER